MPLMQDSKWPEAIMMVATAISHASMFIMLSSIVATHGLPKCWPYRY